MNSLTKKSNILLICPSVHPNNEAASQRVQSFINECPPNINLSLLVLKKIKKEGVHKTFFSLSSNKSPLIIRLFFEVLIGIEASIRILLTKKRTLYIITSPPFFSTLIISIFLVSINRKYCLDIRDIYPEVLFHSGLLKDKSFLGKILLKLTDYIYSHSALITTVTEGCKTSIEKINPSQKNKITVIRNGFDQNHFHPKNQNKVEKFSVVFHGLMGRFQNIQLIKDVASELPDVNFNLIGHGPKEEQTKNSSSKNITFLGEIPFQDIPSQIGLSHLGISPRTEDPISRLSFPVKIFEYIGMGIPVISTPINESHQLIQSQGLGLSCENNLSEIVDFINKCTTDNQFYNQLQKNVLKNRDQYSRRYQSKIFWATINEEISAEPLGKD